MLIMIHYCIMLDVLGILVEIVSRGDLFLAIFVGRNYVDSTEGLGNSIESDNFAIAKLS